MVAWRYWFYRAVIKFWVVYIPFFRLYNCSKLITLYNIVEFCQQQATPPEALRENKAYPAITGVTALDDSPDSYFLMMLETINIFYSLAELIC